MTGDFVWWTDNDKIVIAYENGDGTYTAPQDGGNIINIYCNKTYDEFTSDTGSLGEACPIPSIFHRYIVDGAIAEGYTLPNTDKSMLALFEQRFRQGIVRGQEYSSRDRVKDDAKPAPCNIFQVGA